MQQGKEPKQTDPQPTPPKDVEVAFSGPAVLANRSFATVMQAGVRLAFAEQSSPDAEVAFRAAVLLSFQDAIALRQLLVRMLDPIEAQIPKEILERM